MQLTMPPPAPVVCVKVSVAGLSSTSSHLATFTSTLTYTSLTVVKGGVTDVRVAVVRGVTFLDIVHPNSLV